jgi:hypothetical protein
LSRILAYNFPFSLSLSLSLSQLFLSLSSFDTKLNYSKFLNQFQHTYRQNNITAEIFFEIITGRGKDEE